MVEIDTVTCADVLASPGDRADKLLIFFDGYMKGTSHQTVWDERAEGELINRVMAECAMKTLADESGKVVRGRAVRSGRQAEGSP